LAPFRKSEGGARRAKLRTTALHDDQTHQNLSTLDRQNIFISVYRQQNANCTVTLGVISVSAMSRENYLFTL